MRLRRAILALLVACAVLLGARFLRRGSPSAPGSPGPLRAPPPPARPTKTAPDERRAVSAIRPVQPVDVPSAALPASAYAPIIDMPAEPPPLEGSGDDFRESGLPRALFDKKVALEAEAPS